MYVIRGGQGQTLLRNFLDGLHSESGALAIKIAGIGYSSGVFWTVRNTGPAEIFPPVGTLFRVIQRMQLPILKVLTPAESPSDDSSQDSGVCGSTLPLFEPSRRLPPWLRREVPKGNANQFTSGLLNELRLETVCENAKCPNRMECYSQKTATFMILGNVCTRPCGFCAVARGKPEALELDEPARVAEAAFRLGLKHVVITSVTRDDLPDGGGEHFYQCVIAVRNKTGAAVEVLTPDFIRHRHGLDRVIDSAPEVFNHNMETVPRLYRKVRGPKSEYRWTLELLQHVKNRNSAIKTKSGLMLGLGETRDELLDCLTDLRAYDCDFLTLGQYLQPGPKYLPVVRYVPPEEFEELRLIAKSMGFKKVASGPFVRSSYHARDMADEQPVV
jgi:lipoic acid synthetase